MVGYLPRQRDALQVVVDEVGRKMLILPSVLQL